MALERLTADVAYISKLDNYPPDDPGMTPNKLKSLFDQGSVDIKNYINNTLLPQLEAGYIDSVERTDGDGSPGTTDTYTIAFHDGSTKTFQIYNGRDGIDGEKGDKGDTGNGIASAVLNEDYTLALTFTDGTSYTTPSIRGAKGDKGDTGAGLEFDWNGTQLGIRQEGQSSYQYVNLKGDKGDTGDKGESGVYVGSGDMPEGYNVQIDPNGDGETLQDMIASALLEAKNSGEFKGDTGEQGPPGKNIEFHWNGTQLGVRVEGESEYQYVDLRGPQGPKGDKGTDGKDGYTPQKGVDYYTDADKAEIVSAVLAALPVYEGEVESV